MKRLLLAMQAQAMQQKARLHTFKQGALTGIARLGPRNGSTGLHGPRLSRLQKCTKPLK